MWALANLALSAVTAQQRCTQAEKSKSSGIDAFQIRDEDLASAGNQEKAADLELEDRIEDAEHEEEVEEQLEHGMEAESHQVHMFSMMQRVQPVEELSMQCPRRHTECLEDSSLPRPLLCLL